MINTDLIKFDAAGLVPVVVQDAKSAEVLMVAWANAEALKLTAEIGELVLWSRSRREIWHKGAVSGNKMKVAELRIDCDGDTVLAVVRPLGPACHTGERSCFYRSLFGKENSLSGGFLEELWRYLNQRKNDSPQESYTARLLSQGAPRVAQKVGEEGVETALAAALGDKEGFRYEAADLLYHLLVACIAVGVEPAEILAELKSRHHQKSETAE